MLDIITLTIGKRRATTTGSLSKPKPTDLLKPAKTKKNNTAKAPAINPMWMMVAGLGD